MTTTFVIVGGGQAGARAVDCLRRLGFDGRSVLIGDEPYLPYQRPPLCKRFLSSGAPVERILIRQPPFFETNRIEVRTGVRVAGVDRARHVVELAGGEELGYDKLLLATGGTARRLRVPGGDLAGIHYLRTADDAGALREDLSPGCRLVVVGAGYLGLEVASAVRSLGVEVSILEATERPLSRVVAPVVSEFLLRRHAAAGVGIRCATGVARFVGEDGRVTGVETPDGEVLAADAVVVAIGMVPSTDLAERAGLVCDDGVVVDEAGRTSDPDIYAAGDCTRHVLARYAGPSVRLESVNNAIEQARVAAEGMCGQGSRQAHVPWFWSDQYDAKIQTAGLSAGHDDVVVRGDATGDSFSVWYLRESELVAADTVNRPRELMQALRWIAEYKRPTLALLADDARALEAM